MLSICFKCMKSVSKLILRALSSRALPFFLFRPIDLKISWYLLLRQRQKPCNFLSKPPEVSKHFPQESCFNTLTFHNAPKSQRPAMSPIIQVSFWDTFQDVFLYKFMMQVNKGSEHENTWDTQLIIEEHWSALKNPANRSCLGHLSHHGKGDMGFGLWAGVSRPLPAERLHMDSGCPQKSQKGFGGMMSMPQLIA